MSTPLERRMHDLLRQVSGIYAAVIHRRGDVVVQAGDLALGPRVAPLALALLEGAAGLSGDEPFEQACLSGPARVVNVHRIDPAHLLCIVMEPRSASAQLLIRAEVAALRRAAFPEHVRLQRYGEAGA